MADGQRCTERPAGIARSRLDPQLLELTVAQDLAVGYAIERDPARETKISRARLVGDAAREPRNNLFGHGLHRGREIHFSLRKRFVGVTRRPTEQIVKTVVGHPEPGAVIEIPLV